MAYLVTLVASSAPVTPAHVAALDLRAVPHWTAPGKAVDIPVHEKPARDRIAAWRAGLAADRVDIFVTRAENRVKKLMMSDMDATMVAEETLDEVAATVGLRDVVSALTARAMRGEIEFEDTLRARVDMLRDMPADTLAAVRDAIHFNQGGRELVAALRARGATTVLVSGGFTWFSEYVAGQCGFDSHHANRLEIKDSRLTGKVLEPILGKAAKRDIMADYCARLGITMDDAFAIGDGSNDLPMLEAAGLGIGYRPKPLLLERLDNCIIHGDLTAALYVQGVVPGT